MAWYNASWTYRVQITIDHTQVSSDLTDFPTYVDGDDLPSEVYTNAQADGGDFRITRSDGTTECPFELVSYDSGSSTCELHFKANFISSTSDTSFYLYYGNAGASAYAVTDTYGRNNVWSDYHAVYHGDDLVDSTGNGYTLTAVASAGTGNTSGKLGDCFGSLNGSTQYLYHEAGSDFSGSLTMQAWFYPDTDTGSGQGVIALVDNNTGRNWQRLTFQDNASGNPLRCQGGDTSGNSNTAASTSGPSVTAWNMGHGTVDSDGHTTVYLNAGNTGSSSVYTLSPSTDTIAIGAWETTTGSWLQFFDGLIDEVRIADSELSVDWISAEYTNQNTPTTFYTIGSQETDPAAGGSTFQPNIIII